MATHDSACVGCMVGDNASIHHVQRVSAETAGNAARDKRCGDDFAREDSLGSRHFHHWRVSGGCGAYSFVSGFLFLTHYNNKVRRMVDRETRTWEKVIPGREYVIDSVALPRFCARGRSGGCYCDHRWDKFKLIGSNVFPYRRVALILNGLLTGYVGSVIWVRHRLHCN